MPTDLVAGDLRLDMPAEEYHRRELGVASKSGLDQIRRSPAHYRAWVDGYESEITPAMEFGSLTHLYVLQPAVAFDKVAVRPVFGDLRKTANKEAKAVWDVENAGRLHVGIEDWDKIRRIGDAVHKHPIAGRLVSQCQAEVSAYWVDETGLQCKARLDAWCPSLRIIADLKTCADASEDAFARSVHNFRYHVQDAFYSAGVEAITGHQVKAFVFIAVEKEPPYAVSMNVCDVAAIDRAEELIRRDMRRLAQCIANNEWPAYGDAVNHIALPAWALID